MKILFFLSLLFLLSCTHLESKNDKVADEPKKIPEDQNIIHDERPMSLLLLAENARIRQDTTTALNIYLKLLNKTDDVAVVRQALSLAIKEKDNNTIKFIATRLQNVEPDNSSANFILFNAYLGSANFSEASKNANLAIKKSKNKDIAYEKINSLLLSNPNKEIKLKVVNFLNKKYKRVSLFLYTKAKILFVNKKHQDALKFTNIYLKNNNKSANALILKSEIFFSLKRKNKALKTAHDATKKLPFNDRVLLNYASMQIDYNITNPKMITTLQKAFQISAKRRDAKLLYINAVLTYKAKFFKDAKVKFLQLKRYGIYPQNSTYFLGKIAKIAKSYQDAKDYFSQVHYGEYAYAAVWEFVSVLSIEKKYKQAQMYIKNSSGRFEDEDTKIQLDILLATIYEKQKKYQQGYDILDKYIKNGTEHNDILLTHSLLADKLNKVDIAEKDLLKVIANDNKNYSALNAYAYILLTRFDNRTDEAAIYAKKAFVLKPQNPAIIDTMGWLRFKQKKYKKALKHLQKAHKLLKDPEIIAHLGETLWQLDRQKEAKKIWQEGLKRFPDDEVLLKTYEKYF
jgi:tetratricopeptide (TPR) repeat protein